MPKFIFYTTFFVVLVFFETAHACPSCFASSKTSALQAYYVSIGFMALLPLAMIGAAFVWLRRKQRQFEREREFPPSSQA
jgi:amino acid transporter